MVVKVVVLAGASFEQMPVLIAQCLTHTLLCEHSAPYIVSTSPRNGQSLRNVCQGRPCMGDNGEVPVNAKHLKPQAIICHGTLM